jgi:hypothetical protein
MSDALKTTREFITRILAARLHVPAVVVKSNTLVLFFALAFVWLTSTTLTLLERTTRGALEVLALKARARIRAIVERCGPMMRRALLDNGVYPLLVQAHAQQEPLNVRLAEVRAHVGALASEVQTLVGKTSLEKCAEKCVDKSLERALAELKDLRALELAAPNLLELLVAGCRRASVSLRCQGASGTEAALHFERLERALSEGRREWGLLLKAKKERARFALQLEGWLLEQIPFRFTRGLTRQNPHQAAEWMGELLLFSRETLRVRHHHFDAGGDPARSKPGAPGQPQTRRVLARPAHKAAPDAA